MATATQSNRQAARRWPLPGRSIPRVSWVIAAGVLLHAGCVNLTLPPNDVGGAGGAQADLAPVLDGRAPSGSGGNGGTTGSGTGGSSTPGTDADSGFAEPDASFGGDPLGGSGGVTGGQAGSNEGGRGGNPGSDAAREVADAPPGDASPDAPDDPPSEYPLDAAIDPPGDGPPDAPVVAPTSGLVVYYPCELADGSNLQDLSGKGNSGQIVASSPTGFRFDSGKIGKGLSLSQAGESSYIGFAPLAVKGASALTVATWIKLNSVTPGQRIFEAGVNANLSQNTATGTAYLTLFARDVNDHFGLSSTKDGYGSAIQVTADAFAAGAWRHVAFVIGPGGGTLYLDGASVGTVASMLPPRGIGAIDYAFVGKSQFSSEPLLEAEIDEFRVYNRALTADEIRTVFEYTGP